MVSYINTWYETRVMAQADSSYLGKSAFVVLHKPRAHLSLVIFAAFSCRRRRLGWPAKQTVKACCNEYYAVGSVTFPEKIARLNQAFSIPGVDLHRSLGLPSVVSRVVCWSVCLPVCLSFCLSLVVSRHIHKSYRMESWLTNTDAHVISVS